MFSLNHSFDSVGLDDPSRQWMQKRVRVKAHPEWGELRVVRWYPAVGDTPERLRVFGASLRAPQVVPLADVQVVATELGA